MHNSWSKYTNIVRLLCIALALYPVNAFIRHTYHSRLHWHPRLHNMALPVAENAALETRLADMQGTLSYLEGLMKLSAKEKDRNDRARVRGAVSRSFTADSTLPGHEELRQWLKAKQYEPNYSGSGLRGALQILENDIAKHTNTLGNPAATAGQATQVDDDTVGEQRLRDESSDPLAKRMRMMTTPHHVEGSSSESSRFPLHEYPGLRKQALELEVRIAELTRTSTYLEELMQQSVEGEDKNDRGRVRNAIANSFTSSSSLPGHEELRQWLNDRGYEPNYRDSGLRKALRLLENNIAKHTKALQKLVHTAEKLKEEEVQAQATQEGALDGMHAGDLALDEFADPSTKRIRLATSPFMSAPPTSNKLIICDMNQLLMYKYRGQETGPGLRSNGRKAMIRPFANQFLRSIAEKAHLALWTSGSPHRIQRWEEVIFRNVPLAFRWYNQHCTIGYAVEGSRLVKPLQNVWTHFPQFDQANTVMLDDTPGKMQCNPPHTYLCPPPFQVTFDLSGNPPVPIIPQDRALEPGKGELWLYLTAMLEFDGTCCEFLQKYPYPSRPNS